MPDIFRFIPAAEFPLKELRTYDGHFHGMDGAANLLGEPKEEELPPKYAKDAVSFYFRMAKYGQELIFVTTGPPHRPGYSYSARTRYTKKH